MSNRDRRTWSPAEPPGCRVEECPNLATYCTRHGNRVRLAVFAVRKAIEAGR